MRVLILIAHADNSHQATAFRLAKAAKEALLEAKHEVREVILHEVGFSQGLTENDFKVKKTENFNYLVNMQDNNLIDLIYQQAEHVKWCTNILVFGPMWCYRFPACFHSWIERVLISAPGEGKKVSMVITNDSDEKNYSKNGVGSLEQFLFSEYVAFTNSKFIVTRPLGYYHAGICTIPDPEKEKAWIAKFKKAVIQLDQWQLWGTNNNEPPLNPETILEPGEPKL